MFIKIVQEVPSLRGVRSRGGAQELVVPESGTLIEADEVTCTKHMHMPNEPIPGMPSGVDEESDYFDKTRQIKPANIRAHISKVENLGLELETTKHGWLKEPEGGWTEEQIYCLGFEYLELHTLSYTQDGGKHRERILVFGGSVYLLSDKGKTIDSYHCVEPELEEDYDDNDEVEDE